jgi:arsenite methyltransferase
VNIDQFLIYDELPLWSAPFGLTLLETIRFQSGINILDIGSGAGFPMLEIAERLGNSSKVFGIDPSDVAKNIITNKIRLKGIQNAQIIQGRAEELYFEDGFFGLITSNNGLNNVQDVGKTLEECYRVANNGAQMVLTMNLPHTMIEFYNVFEQVLVEEHLSPFIEKMKEHIQEKRKPVEYWKEAILDAGFRIISINVDGFRYRYANGTAFIEHYFIKEAFMKSWKSIIPEESVPVVFKQIENRLNIIAGEEGELVMSVPFVCFDCIKEGY